MQHAIERKKSSEIFTSTSQRVGPIALLAPLLQVLFQRFADRAGGLLAKHLLKTRGYCVRFFAGLAPDRLAFWAKDHNTELFTFLINTRDSGAFWQRLIFAHCRCGAAGLVRPVSIFLIVTSEMSTFSASSTCDRLAAFRDSRTAAGNSCRSDGQPSLPRLTAPDGCAVSLVGSGGQSGSVSDGWQPPAGSDCTIVAFGQCQESAGSSRARSG